MFGKFWLNRGSNSPGPRRIARLGPTPMLSWPDMAYGATASVNFDAMRCACGVDDASGEMPCAGLFVARRPIDPVY
jgi:hypothetical protein